MSKIKVGIVGFGALGQYLVEQIQSNPVISSQFEIAFIQNRTVDKIKNANLKLSAHQIFEGDLSQAFGNFIRSGNMVDLVIEASHPDVIQLNGELFLSHCDLMITSLTSLANSAALNQLKSISQDTGHRVFIPTGAGWAFEDINKMASLNTLRGLSIAMKFHYRALKLNEPLRSSLIQYIKSGTMDDEIIYRGNVRELAALAPNNVNTMCGLALAGHTVGIEKVQATLIASKANHKHEVVIDVHGPDGYYVRSHRVNPAHAGAVTGSMTFLSFLASLRACAGHPGTGLCFV